MPFLFSLSHSFGQQKNGCTPDFEIDSINGLTVYLKPTTTLGGLDTLHGRPGCYWSFGDSTYNSASGHKRVTHTYQYPGRYRIKLRNFMATPFCGDTVSKFVNVTGTPGKKCPMAKIDFSYQNIGADTIEVTFDCIDNIGSRSIFWNIDGKQTNGQSTVVYKKYRHDIFSGVLTIGEGSGCPSARSVFIIDTFNHTPQYICNNVRGVGRTSTSNFLTPNTVYFESAGGRIQSSLAPFNDYDITWDFGDGSFSYDSLHTKHWYRYDSTYEVSVKFENSKIGCSKTFYYNVDVKTCQAAVDVVGGLSYREAYDTIKLQNKSVGKNLKYTWNLGNGNSSNNLNENLYFTQPLTSYKFGLKVEDTVGGCTSSYSNSVFVREPICNAKFDFSEGIGQYVIDFANNSEGKRLKYKWYFGDGNTSTIANPTHAYSNYGIYNVSLVILDTLSNYSDSTVKSIQIKYTPSCNADFDFSRQGNSNKIIFENKSNGGLLSNLWYFGDGDSSTSKDPEHEYDTTGTYFVTLLINDTSGCSDSVTQMVKITPPLCKAYFTLAVDTQLNFTLFAIEQSSGANLNYRWFFGDGDSSSQQTPTHTYSAYGTYALCLKVWNNVCTDYFCDSFNLDSLGNFSFKNGFKLIVLSEDEVGTNSLEHSNLEVYPNPATSQLTISGLEESSQIEVIGIDGKVYKTLAASGKNELNVDLIDLNSGIYILKVQGVDKTTLFRFIKQ